MTDLVKLAKNLLSLGPHRQESAAPRRIRILFNQVIIADSTDAHFVWEHPYYPQYWLPKSAVKSGFLEKASSVIDGDGDDCGGGVPHRSAYLAKLKVGQRTTDRILLFETGPLDGLVRFEFAAMDAWFEEDHEIYVHPKDPYKRIDIFPSTRTITVKVDGHIIAESSASMFLQETSLPMRYYLPKTSLKWEYITPSSTITRCPYKGEANYYNVTINGKEYSDLFWWYRYPTPESIAIAGRVAPYNERLEILIDGLPQEKK